MKTQQLTDWFPGDVKPVRSGVYEYEQDEYPMSKRAFRWYDAPADVWFFGGGTPKEAARHYYALGGGGACIFRRRPRWRGLRAPDCKIFGAAMPEAEGKWFVFIPGAEPVVYPTEAEARAAVEAALFEGGK